MSYRLHVVIPPQLYARLRKAAQRSGVSKCEWVRRALEESLVRPLTSAIDPDPLARLASLCAPTADIERMLSEIGAGRS